MRRRGHVMPPEGAVRPPSPSALAERGRFSWGDWEGIIKRFSMERNNGARGSSGGATGGGMPAFLGLKEQRTCTECGVGKAIDLSCGPSNWREGNWGSKLCPHSFLPGVPGSSPAGSRELNSPGMLPTWVPCTCSPHIRDVACLSGMQESPCERPHGPLLPW